MGRAEALGWARGRLGRASFVSSGGNFGVTLALWRECAAQLDMRHGTSLKF